MKFFVRYFIIIGMVLTNLCGYYPGNSQNLVPNPGFEDFTMCPEQNGNNQPGPMLCPPWNSVATANYFHVCSSPVWFGVPVNIWGSQYPHGGSAYTGGYFKTSSPTLNEYVQAPLLQTLEAGKCYKVGFWLNLSDESCGVNRVGVLLSDSPVNIPMGMSPQVDWGGSFFSDTVEWTFVWDFVTAVGNEAYITIGNFYSHAQTSFDPDCSISPPLAYYYFDDVIVEEVVSEDFELLLDESAEACDSLVIEAAVTPVLDCVLYHWNTGAYGPEITVYNSGLYTVTATYGCIEEVATIDVTLFNPPAPDLGPDIILCQGESYTLSLDPDVGPYQWNDGSTDDEYTITSSGIYMVTLDDGCDLKSDTIVVNEMLPPSPFTLGPDTILCPGEEITFDFDPALGNFQWQDQNSSPEYTISSQGLYALTISNMCGEESDDIEVEIVQPPFFNLGPDSTTLCTGTFLDIDFDPDMGQFIWQDGSNLPYIHIDSSGTYSLTVTNVCGTDSDEMQVVFIDMPDVQLGVIIQACEGDTIILQPGDTFGNFIWQDGTTLPTLEVTSSGTYSITVSNVCGVDSGAVDMVFYPLISPPDLGPDFSICPGDQAVLYAGSATSNYLWNDLSTADSLVITTEGTYFVQVSNFCGTYSDTVVVSLNLQPPLLNLPADFPLCAGQDFLLDPGIGGVNYSWNDGSVLPQLLITTPGAYSLTVSNACGSDADSILITDGGLLPFVELSGDTSVCAGSIVQLTPMYDHVDSWLWQDGSDDSFYVVSAPGMFFIEVTNACGSAFDTIFIQEMPAIPTLDLGPDLSACSGEEFQLSIPVTDVDILWWNGSTADMVIFSDLLLIYASITNSCGTSSDTVQILPLPPVPALDLGPDLLICAGEVATLNPGISDVDYVWQDGSTGTTFDISQAGTIVLEISNACGTAIDSMVVTETFDSPQVDIGPDLLVCEGDTVTLSANVVGVDFLWNDGSINDEVEVTSSDTIILIVSNLCGMGSDTAVVEINGVPPLPTLGPDTMLCEGLSLTLTSDADFMTNTMWQDGSDHPIFVVTQPGLYILSQTNHCGTAADSMVVDYASAPDNFDLGPDTVLCPGQTFFIHAPLGDHDISWQDGSLLPELLVTSGGTYVLTLENDCGSVQDSLSVTIDQDQPVLALESQIPWCKGDTFMLDATQTFDATYQWSTGAVSSHILITEVGLYAVSVTSSCAVVSQEVAVFLNDDCPEGVFFIPNVFSPNGDNINDLFSMSTNTDTEVLSNEVSIFDRWGCLVYSSTALSFGWDGLFREQEAPPGVYVYMVSVRYKVNGETDETSFRGDVTLIR